jgi:sugar-specific transcriptional regulator TrmB
MDLHKVLTSIGLSDNEIEVYILLLEEGTKSGNEIVTDLKLEKSSVYKALKSLSVQNLITSTGSVRSQKFSASSKESVLAVFKKRSDEITRAGTIFANVFSESEKYTSDKYVGDSIKVYSGLGAATRYHKALLGSNTTFLKTLASTQVQHNVVGSANYVEVNSWFIDERVSKGIAVNVLFDSTSVPDEYDVTTPPLLKECRQLPLSLNLPSIMTIANGKVFFSTTKRNKFWGISIEDETIAILLNSIYDLMWAQAKVI